MGSAAVSGPPLRRAAAFPRGDARAVPRTVIGVLIAAVAVLAGVGWLYLLRDAGLLGVGPRPHGALPLQQLAGDDGQPLLRMAGAWLPTGAAAAAALARLRVRRPVAVVAAVALLTLVLTGAASDAVVNSERFTSHLLPQLTRPALLAALVLTTAGAAPFARRRQPAKP
jgi:hypothetical protein